MPALRPVWLDDEPEIERWLQRALKRLEDTPAAERTKPLTFSANEVLFPERPHHGEEADRRWDKILMLCDLLPLTIKAGRKRESEYDHPYEGKRLHLDLTCEEPLRKWLDRPRMTGYEAAWQTAVTSAQAPWSDVARVQLLNTPLRIEGRSAEEMVNAIVALGAQKAGLSWRELSALVFFGDSKFIENRCEALVQTLYPQQQVRTRPLLISASLPATIRGVLFIENHDTYLRAVEHQGGALRDVALIFTAGFKGSAARVRRRDGAVIHYCNENGARDGFESWWFEEVKHVWPVWFFGDLDFAGMRILAGLHQTFGASAWQPGYAVLLEQLRAGGGHRPDAADKEKQRSVESTGCPYADDVLLPAIRERGAFVDQEAWTSER